MRKNRGSLKVHIHAYLSSDQLGPIEQLNTDREPCYIHKRETKYLESSGFRFFTEAKA